MNYYPVSLDLRGKRCLVVGDSDLLGEKAVTLREAGAVVLRARGFSRQVAADVFLVVADVSETEARRLERYCRRRRILLNVVDQPAYCSFILPAVLRRGALSIAVSTAGNSPSLALRIREELGEAYGRDWAELVRCLGETRKAVKRVLPAYRDRKAFYRQLLDEHWPELRTDGGVERCCQELLKRVEEARHALVD